MTDAPFTTTWDTTTVANGTVAINAKATDVDGNVGIVAADVVVSNGACSLFSSHVALGRYTRLLDCGRRHEAVIGFRIDEPRSE